MTFVESLRQQMRRRWHLSLLNRNVKNLDFSSIRFNQGAVPRPSRFSDLSASRRPIAEG
jgi:hypothetical protein